ncbi:MAG: TrkA C-terminal domain-containing protein, partial [Desulfovibrionaceae bacterium]
ILSCLLAKSMGARQTITRINNFAYLPLIGPIGIDHMVCPRLSAINSLLHYIRRGQVISTASLQAEEAEVLEAIAQEKSGVVGKPLKDIKFPKGALILCFQRGQEVIIPRGDTVIRPGDHMIILSTRDNIPKVEQALDVTVEFMERREAAGMAEIV